MIIYLFMLVGVLSTPTQDLVKQPFAQYVDHLWYSGYLNFTTGDFHYVFFNSQRDPQHDPIVLWLNGGPGCSSLIGMVYENGPFVFIPNTTTLQLNPYSWNKKANLLYIQSPGSVGFSVGRRNNINSDQTVAEDNLKALISFYLKFPNLASNDLYIAGESYAGVYIPYLARKILDYNKLGHTSQTINLKGILVGNGCTDPSECYDSVKYDSMSLDQYEFLYNHNYITQDQHNNIKGACSLNYTSQFCNSTRKQIDDDFAKTKTSILNIYAPCYNQQALGKNKKLRESGKYTQLKDELDCDDTVGILHIFNQALYQVALHVDIETYQMCSTVVAENYIMFQNTSYWLYEGLIKEQLRIWVYSGDVDADVPITGTLKWIFKIKQEIGLPTIQTWRQWWVPGLKTHQDQVAGLTWKSKGLTFASIRGAGHMAPKDKRKEAFIMFEAFKNGQDLPYKS